MLSYRMRLVHIFGSKMTTTTMMKNRKGKTKRKFGDCQV